MITNIDITPILKAFIALLTTIITCFIIPWIRSKTTLNQQEMIRATIKSFVYAAEQIYGAGHGDEKRKYVKEQLKKAGYTYNESEINTEIEAAVGQYLNLSIPVAYLEAPDENDGDE